MRRGLAIRTRLAIVSATLAVGVLAAGLLTVYLIDRRQVDQSLATSARRAAGDLADSTLHRAPPPDSSGGADDAAKESRPESRDEVCDFSFRLSPQLWTGRSIVGLRVCRV